MLLGFGGVQDHQDKIWVFGNGNHLSSSTFSLSGTFDNTGQIQELDFGVVVVDDTWDASQGGELISSWEWFCVGDGAEKCGFTDRGETDHAYSGVSESADFESLSFGIFSLGFKELGSEFGEFGFELTHMILCGLVFLSSGNFIFDLFDLLCDSHVF